MTFRFIRTIAIALLVSLPQSVLAYQTQFENRLEALRENAYNQELELLWSQSASSDTTSSGSVRSLLKEDDTVDPQEVTPGCWKGALPRTIGHPDYFLHIERFDESANVSIWREPCMHDASKSAVFLRIAPSTGNPFICSSSFIVLQNGVQYDSVKLINSVNGDSFCDDLFAPQTFLLDQWSFDNHFNEDRSFVLIYDGYDSQPQVRIDAYEDTKQPEPEPSTEITISLEEPGGGVHYAGIGNLRGWAISSDGIEKIEIYIDGSYAFDAPYGGSRPDVGDIYPEVPGSNESGFSLAYGYANLSSGQHTITARAIDSDGAIKEDSATFTVEGFHKSFIPANDIVDLTGSDVLKNGDEILINDLEVDGLLYDVRLRWRTATQGFEIIEIQ